MSLSKEEAEEIIRSHQGSLPRRIFLTLFCLAIGGFAATIVGIPVVGALIGPLLLQAPKAVWRRVGKVDHFKVGDTVEVVYLNPSPLPWSGVTDRTGAWLRRDNVSHFTAFSINCQHLGCPVRWEPAAQLFLCPCHGGVYYADGSVAAGPPPRSLQTYPVRIRDGEVEVRTSPIPLPGFE